MLIIDLEATCWKGNQPPGEVSDIIEIGLCVFDLADSTLSDNYGIIVRPTRSRVSEFCTELTGMTQSIAESGAEFSLACEMLQARFNSSQIPWASWGEYDRRMFKSQCEELEVPYPLGEVHTNLKKEFARHYGIKKLVGMSRALRQLGMNLEGKHHSGKDDARNIARILERMMENGFSFD